MKSPNAAPPLDPRHEIPRYANQIAGLCSDGRAVHVNFAITRPAAGETPGPRMRLETEIVARVVLTLDAAQKLAETIDAALKGHLPSTTSQQH